MEKSPHSPVLINEIIKIMNPQPDKIYVDATFGAGGYSRAFLKYSKCIILAIDKDNSTKKYADNLSTEYKNRFSFEQCEFSSIQQALKKKNLNLVNGIVFDLGVSSMQLDTAARGFSFQQDADLDMRMDQKNQITTAADLVNQLDETTLANIIYHNGGEKKSRKIAKAITTYRQKRKIKSTTELADIVKKAVVVYKDDIHPATRTFQALRIEVNNELEQLQKGIESASELLKINGILAVVTFHSLEDKIVKNYFNKLTGKIINNNRYFPDNSQSFKNDKIFELTLKKVIKPSSKEVQKNRRARSAKLRAIRRVK